MMRLGRRTPLLIVFLLLASTATAYAECAWVLWREEETVALASGVAKVEWAAPIAYADRAACVAVIDSNARDWEKSGTPNQNVHRVSSGTAAEFRTRVEGKGWNVIRQYCLPDTVDARGPKGK